MCKSNVPLTPAEQMHQIREAITSADKMSSQEAYFTLVDYFSRMEKLRDRVADLESKMLIQEQPFESHAPLIGKLIVQFRKLWNWMSTKWYVLPLIKQQSDFNMSTTQSLREIVIALESLARSVKDMEMRIEELETSLPTSQGEE